MKIHQREIRINNRRIAYLEAGATDAPVVVLFHGGGIDGAWVSWRHLIPALARTHRVLAPDLPGYGLSEPPPSGQLYTTEYLVRIATAFLDALELEQIVLGGLSMGGATALGVALKHPARVRRLILIDAYGLQDEAPLRPLAVAALGLPATLSEPLWSVVQNVPLLQQVGLAAIFHNPLRLTDEILADAAENVRLSYFYEWLQHELSTGIPRTNYTSQLAEFHVPTLLVHGQHDPSIPLQWARRAAEKLPNAELLVVRGCGHWPNREQPQAVNQAVVMFVNAISSE